MKVSDLIRLAGGFQDTADLSMAELTRLKVVNNQIVSSRQSVELQRVIRGDSQADLSLEKGDYLIIKPLPNSQNYRTVKILGEVAQPGVYTVREGETLSDVVMRAGGMTSRAYSRGAIFTRESVKRLQEQRLQEFAQRLEEDMYRHSAKAVQTALSQETITAYQDALNAKKALLECLKQSKPTGRMIVSVDQLIQRPHSPSDVPLEEGDVLLVPPVLNSVAVLGQVFNPTSLVCDRNMTVDDCLIKTGGARENADIQGVYVVKADGSVWSDKNVTVGWGPWRKGVRGAPVEPGDTIMVPEKLAVDTSLRDFRDITQILFQIATTAAIAWGIVR
jgi:protein involved in polysaccharide export with SLBB domain